MRFSLGTMFLIALSGTAAMVGHTPFKRDLKLSAELGVHPDELLASKTSVNAIASARLDTSIPAEYASVSNRCCSGRSMDIMAADPS
jgi:hypothetical protein